jgi:hypothetical protein
MVYKLRHVILSRWRRIPLKSRRSFASLRIAQKMKKNYSFSEQLFAEIADNENGGTSIWG